jgi:hypothetical protein
MKVAAGTSEMLGTLLFLPDRLLCICSGRIIQITAPATPRCSKSVLQNRKQQ